MTGGVTGTLPGTVNLADTAFFNEFSQGITLGGQIGFTLGYTENFAGGSPDEFSLFLLDDLLQPLFHTTDISGADALLTVDLNGNTGGEVTIFAGDPLDTHPQAAWTAVQAQVPEPGLPWLWGVGLWGGWFVISKGARASRPWSP